MRRRLPTQIHLAALGERWPVYYEATREPHVGARSHGGAVIVRGRVRDATACRESLKRWLRRRAHDAAGTRLHDLADVHGLPAPARIRSGFPRTRWASCSARGTVSVNARSLFLPSHLFEHVLVHELCHLEHLNHSADFYALLASCDPGHDSARVALREGWRHVPGWVDA